MLNALKYLSLFAVLFLVTSVSVHTPGDGGTSVIDIAPAYATASGHGGSDGGEGNDGGGEGKGGEAGGRGAVGGHGAGGGVGCPCAGVKGQTGGSRPKGNIGFSLKIITFGLID